jgi:4-hydroxythreonine-4-phosphate dehydrogenase
VIPRLVLTSGEPAGIGPDVCLGALSRDWACELVVLGNRAVFEARAASLGLTPRFVAYARDRAATRHRANELRLIDFAVAQPVVPGHLDARNAPYVLALLDRAVDGCCSGEFQAMVTAPLQKSVISDSGVPFMGHTEYLAARLGVARPVMMLVAGPLRVALVTTHLPLAQVPAAITCESVTATVRIVHDALRTRWRIAKPRVAVCGLNPHAGERGHLGDEEIRVITPALASLRSAGLDIVGPLPADTAFTPRALAGIDAVVAMYHDQGLPVLKASGFGEAVNVTLGLPIIRTSVDHGTALDLAGSGRADPSSLGVAIDAALTLIA